MGEGARVALQGLVVMEERSDVREFSACDLFSFLAPRFSLGGRELLLGPQAGGCGPGLGAPAPCHLPDRCAIAVQSRPDVPPYRRR